MDLTPNRVNSCVCIYIAECTHPVRMPISIQLLVLDDFIELRQARRDRQLVSRRLLPGENEDQADVAMDTKTLEEVGC